MNDMKPISINDLKGSKKVEVDISELKPKREVENVNQKFIDQTFGLVDQALGRIANEAKEYQEKLEQEEFEEQLEKEIESEAEQNDDGPFLGAVIGTEDEIKVITNLTIDDEDFDDIDEDVEEDTKSNSEKQMKDIKTKIKEKVKPIANIIDLSTFTISSKPVSVSNALKATTSNKHIADWVFPAEGRSISIEEFTGLELERLNPANSSRNRLNTYKDIYELIFKHIVDANKPATMEQWVKKLNFFDLDHLYFAIYKASFEGSNFIPYNCPHCGEVFVSEDVSIDDMVKYKDEKSKERIMKLLNSDTTTESEGINIEVVQISDNYVAGLKEPSVYNMIFEHVILDEDFTEKYSELLSLITFIDTIYYIDRENNELRPIEPKVYPDNMVKTVKSKISTYGKILQSLSSDQFYQFNAYMKAIQERHDELSYRLPAVKCPKCEKEIKEAEMTAEGLLFTRCQLVGIANM